MKTVRVTTELGAPADVVWAALKTPHAFVHVAGGMLRYPVAERLDRPWRVGDRIRGWTFLFGFLPFSRHQLAIDAIDEEGLTVVSNERGGIVRRWCHWLELTPTGERTCRYEDRVELDAGPLSGLVAAFAKVFYRHRQRRWRALARLLGAASS